MILPFGQMQSNWPPQWTPAGVMALPIVLILPVFPHRPQCSLTTNSAIQKLAIWFLVIGLISLLLKNSLQKGKLFLILSRDDTIIQSPTLLTLKYFSIRRTDRDCRNDRNNRDFDHS